ncbi:hydratase [Bordetella genomosp. 1]|uniref:Hydratase n=2 Tax=Bordetella genomosp. 1 TaxID=1395607 RepID=A0ABX4EYL0_9BORD|nr:hydratase [Bordetella genomosp. 1]
MLESALMEVRIEPYPGCDEAARYLLAARHRGEPGPRLPEHCRPATLGQALAVQMRTAELQQAQGAPIAAWKSAVPTPEKIAVAPIYAPSVHQSRHGTAPAADAMVRIEPEIAFELARDLPARETPYAPADVDAAVGAARLALEVLGCRYSAPQHVPLPELLADHMFNQGLVLGPEIDAPAPAQMPIEVYVDGALQEDHDGVHPNTDPRAGLYWIAEFLRAQGLGLRAGQHVITGSYAGYIDVPANREVRIVYGTLGEIALRFVR